MTSKQCKSNAKSEKLGFICNPQTGKWVKIDGVIGKKVLEKYSKEQLSFSGPKSAGHGPSKIEKSPEISAISLPMKLFLNIGPLVFHPTIDWGIKKTSGDSADSITLRVSDILLSNAHDKGNSYAFYHDESRIDVYIRTDIDYQGEKFVLVSPQTYQGWSVGYEGNDGNYIVGKVGSMDKIILVDFIGWKEEKNKKSFLLDIGRLPIYGSFYKIQISGKDKVLSDVQCTIDNSEPNKYKLEVKGDNGVIIFDSDLIAQFLKKGQAVELNTSITAIALQLQKEAPMYGFIELIWDSNIIDARKKVNVESLSKMNEMLNKMSSAP